MDTTAAGDFDQRVTFLRQATTKDTQGGRSVTWPAIAGLSRVAAQVTWGGGDEAVHADQLVAQRRGTVRVRRSAAAETVSETDRVIWRGRTLAILAIVPGGLQLREWLAFSVVERSA